MSRREYMEQLAYLLQDLPEEERADVLQYYEDYFDEGGAEQEEQIIRTLGSPERLAAMIKDGVRFVQAEEQGEYTDSGYRDERFREDDKVPQEYDSEEKDGIHRAQELLKNGDNRNLLLWLVILVIIIFALGWRMPGLLVVVFIYLVLNRMKKDKK